jgi:integrase
MARVIREARIESRTARAKLRRGRQPHLRTITVGRAALGYVRKPGAPAGRWILRRLVEGDYRVMPLGVADDAAEADGDHVLSFEQAEAKARAMLDRPAAAAGRLTVRAALERYIDYKRDQGQSVSDLISRSDAHIIPVLGNKVVSELTAEQLRRWLATLAAMPAMVRPKRGGKQSYRPEPASEEEIRQRRASANRVLNYLKAALNHAYDEKHVTTNEAWGRRLKRFREVEVARVRYLTVAEATRLINACDPEFRPLVIAALQTGCRYGELIKLEVSDFNADAGTVGIRKSKSGKARHVVLTDEGVAFFRLATAGRAGDELLFRRHANGRPWRKSDQAKPMRAACAQAAIIPRIGIHQLRHTWASHAVMNGVPLMVVARNLGHTDTRMVERHYGHLAPSFITDAIRAGAPRFGLAPDPKVVPIR